MVTKKDMAVAILATFCLTSTLFMAIPTKSQVGTTSSNEYDPWIDTNDDGIIDIFDIAALALAFGAEGEPINKTALILELQSRVDSLNSSLIELMNQTRNIYEVDIIAYCSFETEELIVDITKDDAFSGFNTTHKFILIGNHTFKVPETGPNNHVFTHWNTGSTDTEITVSSSGQYVAYYEMQSPNWFNGLIGYWKLDEGIGTMVGDSSSNGNNGTLLDGPTWINGKYGKALGFDGIDDYVLVQDSPSLDATLGITIAAWIYPIQFDGKRSILGKIDDSNPSTTQAYTLHLLENGELHLNWFDSAGSEHKLTSTTIVDLNKWSYVVGTYDGSYNRLYINGQLIGLSATSGIIRATIAPSEDR